MSASRGSPPGASSVGGGQAGMGSGLNCGQGSPGTTSGSGGSGGGGAGGGGVSCVGADVSVNETTDWRSAHSIAALRAHRRASDASQQYSPQHPPPHPGPPYNTPPVHDLEYSSVY